MQKEPPLRWLLYLLLILLCLFLFVVMIVIWRATN